MSLSKRTFRLLLTILSLAGGSLFFAGAHAESLRVGFFDLPPHSIQDATGVAHGAAIEYVKQITDRMGISDVEFIQYPLPRLLLMLEQERMDVVILLAKSPERASKFSFTQTPLYSAQPVISVRASQTLDSITSAKDLLPLKIGMWQNGYQSPLLNNTGQNLHTLTGNEVVSKGVAMVVAGRIDGFYFPDAYALDYEVERSKLQGKIKILPMPEPELAFYSVFSKSAGEHFLARYEQALSAQQTEAPYETFLIRELAGD